MNISIAFATIDAMISATNDKLDINPKDKGLKKETLANIEFIDKLLGVGSKEPFSYFQIGVDKTSKAKIESLIEQRNNAKKAKDYLKADKIREDILDMGIAIMDRIDGTVWEKI